jgi:DNA-binding LacI/PurR family transcriptional regulator
MAPFSISSPTDN